MRFNNFHKICFDLIMFVLLAAVYCAQPTGIPVHEYIGIGIYIFFIIHLVYNYKWIINVSKKLFDKSVDIRTKFMYAVDFLLLIAFLIIGFSGIMISHVLFKFGIMPTWRPLHSIISAVSIILLGIHIGLHGDMIINAVKTKIKLPFKVIKITASVIFIIIFLAGIYGDVISKIQPNNNKVTSRPKYETVLALFTRSVNLLSGPPEYVRNRASANESSGNRGESQRSPKQNSFNISVLLISVSNYIAFIVLCSIIVYLIDNVVKKKKSPCVS